MARRDLLAHLRANGCRLHRQGGKHEIWVNPTAGGFTSVPRHRAIPPGTCRAICTQLGIPRPLGL